MEKRSRRTFTAAFKAKVVIEALKERSTIEELARKHEIHPTQIVTWKKAFLENASAAFDNGESKGADEKQREDEENKLYARIGQLEMQNNWLKKKLDL
ncbi:MAG: transposase [Methylococcales bacterium]